jgi:hypothetical protein
MRRAVARQGHRLSKSRVRDPRAVDFGRYYIVEPHRNQIIAGVNSRMMLEDVERWVTRPHVDHRSERERAEAEKQVRQTAYQMLGDFARLVDGIAKTPRLQELPEWLKVREYEEEFRHYFKGGVADLQASVANAPRAIDALNALIAQFPAASPRPTRKRSV